MAKKVLIIDDEKDMRVYLEALFRKAGYDTETAADGSGVVVPAQSVTSGDSITAYAITRDLAGNFVANPTASW